MGNGFIVTIENNTNTAQEIKLFSGILPEGVIVQTLDGRYDFDGLKLAAQINPLKGDTLTTNYEASMPIEIISPIKTENIQLNGRHEGVSISINGKDKFISISCPPSSKFYIRLN